MRCGLALALVTAFAAQDPAAGPGKPLTLELRVFNGPEEVTAHTRATVHRAGDRGDPLVQTSPADGRVQLRLPAGGRPDVAIYEAGKREKPAAVPVLAPTYLLFVVRAGSYDLVARASGRSTWHTGVDVPLDRTRLWVTP